MLDSHKKSEKWGTNMASDNKVAIITGAGSGIGKATALAFLSDGYQVAFAGRRKETLESAIAEAGVDASRAIAVPTDVSDASAVNNLFSKTRESFGRVDVVSAGSEAWSYNSMRGFDVLKGDQLTQALLEHPGAVEGDWNDYFDSVEVVRSDTVNDRPVHVIRLKKGDLPSRTYWIDAEHGDVLRVKLIAIEASIRIPVTITYSEFEEFDGIRSAMRVEIRNPASGKMVLTVEKVESGIELGDSVFRLEDPDAKEGAKN